MSYFFVLFGFLLDFNRTINFFESFDPFSYYVFDLLNHGFKIYWIYLKFFSPLESFKVFCYFFIRTFPIFYLTLTIIWIFSKKAHEVIDFKN